MEVKQSKIFYLMSAGIGASLILYISFGPYEKTRFIFERNFPVAIIFSTLIIGTTIYSLFKLLDNKPVIILSKNGIWTKKTGDVLWKDIESFDAKITKSEQFDSTTLNFKISGQDKVIAIDTSFLSPDIKDIVEYININSTNKDIVNSDFEHL